MNLKSAVQRICSSQVTDFQPVLIFRALTQQVTFLFLPESQSLATNKPQGPRIFGIKPLVRLLVGLGILTFTFHQLQAAPVPEQQIYITSKFVELHDQEYQKKTKTRAAILSAPQFQTALRKLNQERGSDLLSAPSVVTRDQHHAKIEVVREYSYPLEDDENQGKINFGVLLEVKPSLLPSDRIKLAGKTIVRSPEGGEHSLVHSFQNQAGGSLPAVDGKTGVSLQTFQTREFYFDAILDDGETIQLILGERNEKSGQLQVFVTARMIDPAGHPINPDRDSKTFFNRRPLPEEELAEEAAEPTPRKKLALLRKIFGRKR